jgi:hypothetical protein
VCFNSDSFVLGVRQAQTIFFSSSLSFISQFFAGDGMQCHATGRSFRTLAEASSRNLPTRACFSLRCGRIRTILLALAGSANPTGAVDVKLVKPKEVMRQSTWRPESPCCSLSNGHMHHQASYVFVAWQRSLKFDGENANTTRD